MHRLRQLFLLVVFLGITIAVYAQAQTASNCDYIIELYDSGNDGWDGAYLEVSINEGPITIYNVPSGSFSSYTLSVNNGATIDINYIGAANELEHSFAVFDALGSVVYEDGPTPNYGAVPRIKAACPRTCVGNENFIVLITTGNNPEQISWELSDGSGSRVAYANAGTYLGLEVGVEIPVPVALDLCENYSFTVFDAANNSWNLGTFDILSLNADRGQLLTGGSFDGYYNVLSGPGVFTDQREFEFTLPCIECPADKIVHAPLAASNNCELAGYVYPAIDIPAPIICYPNNSHGTPAPSLSISYPTAIPAIINAPLWAPANLPIGVNPVVFETTYADGQILRCTSSLNVVAQLNPTIAVNDNVSLPIPDVGVNDCMVFLRPDMVLEAAGYCEGEYIVTAFDPNGAPLGSYVGPDQVGQTLYYEVVHIASQNFGSGTITIEDNRGPQIYCHDYEIACNHPEALNEFYKVIDEVYFPIEGSLPANVAGGGVIPSPPSVTTLNIPVECTSRGEIVYNLTVNLNISHTDIGDLSIVLKDPLGNTSLLMGPNVCAAGEGEDLTVTFNSLDANISIASACDSPNIPSVNGSYLPLQNISYAGEEMTQLVGTWQIIITDGNNTQFPDGEVGLGEVTSAEIVFTKGFPLPYSAADCSDFEVTLLNEIISETNCSTPWIGAEIIRIWSAADVYGNVSTCEQKVKLRAPSFDELDLPADIDIECGNPATLDLTGIPKFDCFNIEDDQDNICDLSYTFSNTEIPSCGLGKKIIREWTIVNWCSSTTLQHTQVVKIEDTTGPTISAEDITTSTSSFTCGTDISLSTFVTDECSSVQGVTASYIVGGGLYNASGQLFIVNVTNTGILSDLPLGLTEVLIRATDACGNYSLDTIDVNVVDDVPPTAICDDNLHISLQGNGTARVYASNLSEGSHDNCEIDSILVRRTDGCLAVSEFDSFVEFACCDIESMVTVELKVTDIHGNSSICWSNIVVEDKLAPILTCPANVNIDCSEDYSDPNVFGEAEARDNCSATLSVINESNIDNCGVGTIKRTFTAEDDYGNAQSCIQTITVSHVSDFAIQFPDDVLINTCTDDSSLSGEPIIQNKDCELIAISHSDVVYDLVPDACYKIVRTWSVINWCTYDINAETNTKLGLALPLPRTYKDDGDGYFEYNQIIKVLDNVEPVFDSSTIQDINVDIVNGCEVSITLPEAIANDACSGQIIVSPETAALTGMHGDVFTVNYNANDGCGNSANAQIEVSFFDTKAPTPVCINGLAVEIMQSGQITIWAADFESGSSFDNCAAYNNLKFSFSSDINDVSKTYDCDDLGSNTLELWATDEVGNQDFCTTYLIVQDNMNVCSGSGSGSNTVSLGGGVYNEEGQDIEKVLVNLSGNNSSPFLTAGNANYAFSNLPMNNSYTITPGKDVKPLNGVTTYDLVLMSQHILGISVLNSPYKLIAADINGDGKVSTFDMVQLRQLILYIIADFPSNNSWRFVEADYAFSDPSNPWSEAFPEFISKTNVQNNAMDLNFIGVKVGDVNCSAVPGEFAGSEDRSEKEALLFATEDLETQSGEEFSINFMARDFESIAGFQYSFSFDSEALEFVQIEKGALEIVEANFGMSLLEEGIITTSWNALEGLTIDDDKILFSLKFSALKDAQLSDLIELNSQYTEAEAYSIEENETINVELTFVNPSHLNSNLANVEFELLQNKPNPFNEFTSVGFMLPTDAEATLTIYNLSGKLLKTYQAQFSKGYNEFLIENSEINATGILYYEFRTEGFTDTKKMLIVK